jgi:anti-sigma B factor antagonist
VSVSSRGSHETVIERKIKSGWSGWSGWFDVEDRVDGHRHILVLRGELDMLSSLELEAMVLLLAKRDASCLVLDLSRLTFIDLRGLRMVLFAKELCDWDGCEFRLVPGPPCVQRVFELTDLLDVLPFEPDAARRLQPAGSGHRW